MESKGTDAGKSSSRKSFPVQTVYSTALHGIDGQIVTVESSCAPSPEHRLEIIGLPDTAVKESAARVRSAALLTGALPRLLSQAALDEAGVPRAAACAALTARQIAALWRALRAFPLRVAGTLGLSHAQVTRGGVALREIDPHTMASRLFPGLYVAGELLDADGPCGGYNLHFAFAGALAAADAIASAPGA